MKKMLRGFALILALTLAATLCIPAFAAEGATESERNIELPTDEVLLATVQDNIDAYAEYYFLHSVTVNLSPNMRMTLTMWTLSLTLRLN